MKSALRKIVAAAALAACVGASAWAAPNAHPIDRKRSKIVVHVYKTGLFSIFAHNHEIEAPIESGEVVAGTGEPSVAICADANKLRVLDPEVSAGTRSQIQKTMESSQVLDAGHYSNICFHSTAVQPKGIGRWLVNGVFELHGRKRPVATVVTLKDGRYAGSLVLKQTEFGITPIAIAGRTVKVKDQVTVDFDIALSQ